MAKTGTGTYLPLPPGARGPYAVYVNGDERTEGTDFVEEDGGLRFVESLRWAKKTGRLGWTVMFTAGVGFYEERDTIDVHCSDASGAPLMLAGLQVREDV
jgi:hypothetical protein